MNFIKKIFNGEVDETVHFQFIRFGKGDYKGRFPLSLWKTKKVKLRTSFEFVNDIVLLCAKIGNCKVSGEVISKDDCFKKNKNAPINSFNRNDWRIVLFRHFRIYYWAFNPCIYFYNT